MPHCTLIILIAAAACSAQHVRPCGENIKFVKEYFIAKRIARVTSYSCWGKCNHQLMKELSKSGIQSTFVELMAINDNVMKSMKRLSEWWPEGVLLDLTCHSSAAFLEMAHRFKMFDSLHFWLVFHYHPPPFKLMGNEVSKDITCNIDPSVMNEVQEIFSKSQMLVDSEVTIAVYRRTTKGYLRCLFDVYRVKVNDTLILTPSSLSANNSLLNMPLCQPRVSLGSLVATKFHEITTQTNDTKCFVLISPRVIQPTSIRRNNLQGATLRAGTVIIQPELFTGMHDLTMRHIDTWTKINYILVEQMSLDLNLNFILHYFNSWGSQNNGTFDGLVGSFQRQELDLGATGMFFKKDRFMVMEYIGETFQFSSNVWMCAVIIFTMKVIALTLEMRVEGKYQQKSKKRKKKHAKVTKRDINFGEVIMMVVGAACQQGYYSPPSCFSARITFLALWFTSLFLFTSYAATVVALLQTPSHFIKSLADLVNGPMEVGIQDQIYNHVYFRETTDPLAIELYHRKIEPRLNNAYYDAMEGMERVKKGLFAFQVEHAIGYKIISETFPEGEKCYLGNVELFPTLKLGIPIARDSPYKEIFAQKLHHLREVGVLERTLKQWIPQKPSCTHSHSSGLRQFVCIGLDDLHPAFSLLYAGAILGILLLGFEYLIQQYLYRKKFIFQSRRF